MRNRVMDHRHFDPRAIGRTSRLLDSDGNFQSLAVAPAHSAAAIADNHQAGETKTAATLDDSSTSPDLQNMLDLIRFSFSHDNPRSACPRSELQPRPTGTFRECGHSTVIAIRAAIKDHFGNTLLQAPLGDGLTDRLSRAGISAVRQLFA